MLFLLLLHKEKYTILHISNMHTLFASCVESGLTLLIGSACMYIYTFSALQFALNIAQITVLHMHDIP